MVALKRYLISALLTGWVTFAHAAPKQEELPQINVRFTSHAVGMPSDQEVLFESKPGKTNGPIVFYTSRRSTPEDYTGPNPIVFFSETQSVNKDQPPARHVLAKANIPEGITRPLLIFFKNPSTANQPNELPYVVYVFDDSPSNFLPGHLTLLNASGLELVGRINKQLMEIKPGLNPPMLIGKNASIELKALWKERYYQSYASSIPIGTNERLLLLLLPPYHKGSIEAQVRLLQDKVE